MQLETFPVKNLRLVGHMSCNSWLQIALFLCPSVRFLVVRHITCMLWCVPEYFLLVIGTLFQKLNASIELVDIRVWLVRKSVEKVGLRRGIFSFYIGLCERSFLFIANWLVFLCFGIFTSPFFF